MTLHVPAAAWRQLPRAQLEWLVPGLLRDKCIALLREPAKAQRRRLVPLPDSVDRLLPALRPNAEPLTSALTSALRSEAGRHPGRHRLDGWHHRRPLPDAGRTAADEQNRVLFASRDPAALDAFVATLDRQRLLPLPAGSPWRRERSLSWDFDALPESVDTQQAGIPIKRFVRMIDHGDHIQLELGDDPVEARQSRVRGILRLYMLALAPTVHYLRKQVRFERERALTFAAIAGAHDLIDELIEAAFRAILLDGRPLLTDRASFEARVAADHNQVVTRAQELVRLVSEILACYRPLRLQLEKTASPALADSHRDIEQQLAALLAPGFITATPTTLWLSEFPRYLKAIDHRLQRLQGTVGPRRAVTPYRGRSVAELPRRQGQRPGRSSAARRMPLADRGAAGLTLRPATRHPPAGVGKSASSNGCARHAVGNSHPLDQQQKTTEGAEPCPMMKKRPAEPRRCGSPAGPRPHRHFDSSAGRRQGRGKSAMAWSGRQQRLPHRQPQLRQPGQKGCRPAGVDPAARRQLRKDRRRRGQK